MAGKPSRWLVDAVLATPIGSGTRDRWGVTVLHRTLVQTGREPHGAPVALARLLAQLDLVSAAGVIIVGADAAAAADDFPAADERTGEASTSALRFRFAPFALPEPGRHTDSEYL